MTPNEDLQSEADPIEIGQEYWRMMGRDGVGLG